MSINGAAKIYQARMQTGLPIAPNGLQEQVLWLHIPVTKTENLYRVPSRFTAAHAVCFNPLEKLARLHVKVCMAS